MAAKASAAGSAAQAGAAPFLRSPRLSEGQVLDVSVVTRSYRVACGPDILTCWDLRSGTGFGPFGAADISAYPPGASVVVVDFGHAAYILGAYADVSGSARTGTPDLIVGSTGVDAFNLLPHYYVSQLGPPDVRAGRRPFDALPGSSEGRIGELGTGYGADRFFAWLRASELAGLWCFYEDGLSRLAAYNFDFWTAGGEETIRSDGGEVSGVRLYTPYGWEALGLRGPGEALEADPSNQGGTYRTGQWKSWLGPREPNQTVRPRDLRFDGYAGDLSRQQVCYPLTGEHEVETTDSEAPYAGLSDIHRGVDGTVAIRSAKRVLLEKYALLPVPRVRHLPEDPQGDDLSEDYRAAGLAGGGPDRPAYHRKQWDWKAQALPAACWIPALWDYHAHEENYASFQALLGHEKDFWVPEEGRVPGSDTDGKAVSVGEVPMGWRPSYPPPDFASLRVDHRFVEPGTRYYRSRSFVELLDDGSVVIEDGYGSSILMSGGNVSISCPGDINLRPGRSLISWAPADTVLRSGGAVDLSSSHSDIRLKAEQNVHVLAGNSGQTGGILMESRAAGQSFDFRQPGEQTRSSGIVLLAKNSQILGYAREALVRTDGDLVLEASDGRRIDVSRTHLRWAGSEMTDTIGDTPRPDGTVDESAVTNTFTTDLASFGGRNAFKVGATNVLMAGEGLLYSRQQQLLYRGTAVFQGSVLAAGSLYCGGPSISAGANFAASHANPGGAVGRILKAPDPPETDEPFEKPAEQLTELQERIAERTAEQTSLIHEAYYQTEERIGSDDFWKAIGFSCRTERDYHTDGGDYIVAESRWQQAYRTRKIGKAWDEPAVRAPTGEQTAPHPGRQQWDGPDSYLVADPQLWDWETGRNVDRSDLYEQASAPPPDRRSLSKEYVVSV